MREISRAGGGVMRRGSYRSRAGAPGALARSAAHRYTTEPATCTTSTRKGTTVKPIERRVEKPSTKTELLIALWARFCRKGVGASKIAPGRGAPTRRAALVLAVLATTLGALALSAPALAAAPEAPELTVQAPVKATEATFHGVVNPLAVTFPVEAGTYQFVYRPSSKAEDECKGAGEVLAPPSAGMYFGLGPESFSETATGLTAGTEYAVCLVVEDKEGKTLSPAVLFKTAIPPEAPEELEAKLIAATTATLSGVLNPKAEGDPGTYEFLYSRSASVCEGGTITPAEHATGAKLEAAEAKVAGLLPHTAYTFCLRAYNEAGEESALSSPPVTFTTLAAPPTIGEAFSTDVTATSATLHAQVNPQGASTSYTFEYAPAGSEFKPVPEPDGHGSGTLPEGTTGAPVEVHLQEGLAPDTAYEFRVVAQNSVEKAPPRRSPSLPRQALPPSRSPTTVPMKWSPRRRSRAP
jgi:hypothetical protein